MSKFYSLLIAMLMLINIGMAQQTSNLDLNGDPIPPEALITADLHSQNDVIVPGTTTPRAEWMAKGPWGGNIRGFATDGMKVVAACGHSTAGNGGIWYSTDGGQNWNGSDINNKIMYAALAHPTQSNTFLAGGKYGIYRSEDGGATWLQIAYPSTTIIGLGVQIANTDLMIAGIASNQGVRYSPDGGTTWNTTNLTQGYMKDFAVSPDNPERMLVAVSGTAGSGLYSSTDGAIWVSINPAGSGQCYGIYLSPDDGDFMLLGAETGIYKSTDGGQNWTLAQSTSNFARGIVKYNSTFYSVVYGGSIYESTDNGDTWTVASENIVERTWQAIGASDAGALFGSWGSVVLGNASGYALSVEGMNNVYVHSAVYYADRNEIWAGSEGSGIWRSTNMGESWENKSNGLQGWWAYGFAPTNSDDWAVDRRMVATNNGVFYSDDFGESWEVLNQETTYYTGAMVHPTNPDIMWIAGSTGPIKYTTDGGASWNDPTGLPFGFYPRFGLSTNPSGDLRVLLIYEQLATNSVFSDDLGASFLPCTGISGVSYFTDISIRLADSKLDQMVYMSTDQGIFKSPDGEAYTLCPNISGLFWSVLGTEGSDVYAGASNGVFHSADEGQTWEAFNQGISTMAIWDIAYGSSTSEILAGTRGYGVYKYGDSQPGKVLGFVRDAATNLTIAEAEIEATNLDDGVVTTATPFGSHYSLLLPPGIYDIACTADGYQTAMLSDAQIEAGVNMGHTFYLDVAEETTTGISSRESGQFTIYPNPAGEQFTLTGNDITTCEIYSQAGQLIQRVNITNPGQIIKTTGLPAGIYFIRILGNQTIEIQKLIIE